MEIKTKFNLQDKVVFDATRIGIIVGYEILNTMHEPDYEKPSCPLCENNTEIRYQIKPIEESMLELVREEFRIGDRVVAYSCKKCADQMRYRSVGFHGTITEIKNGVATVAVESGNQYHYLICLRHEDEVMQHLRQLWSGLADIAIDDDDCICSDYHIWEKGTDRQEIWHWFDEQCPNGIGKDLP